MSKAKVKNLFELKPEPCKLAVHCLHLAEDCTDRGKNERGVQCYELKKEEPPAILTENVDLGESVANEGNGAAEVGETDTPDPSNEVEKQEESMIDASESIPETTETVTAGGHKTFPRTLHVSLTEEELANSGSEMARLIAIWTKAKLDKKAYDRASKKLIDDTEEKYVALAEAVEAGSEEREVLCYWEYKPETGAKCLYRCDNGDVVEEANMGLLDYENCPGHNAKESIENAEALRQGQGENEQPASESGEPSETQGEGQPEEESPLTEEISHSEGEEVHAEFDNDNEWPLGNEP